MTHFSLFLDPCCAKKVDLKQTINTTVFSHLIDWYSLYVGSKHSTNSSNNVVFH